MPATPPMFIPLDSVSRSTCLSSIGIKGTSRSRKRPARNCLTSTPLVYLKRILMLRQRSPTSGHSIARSQQPKALCQCFSTWLILPKRHPTKVQQTCLGTSKPRPILIKKPCKSSNSNSSWSTRGLLWNLLRGDIYRPPVGTENRDKTNYEKERMASYFADAARPGNRCVFFHSEPSNNGRRTIAD